MEVKLPTQAAEGRGGWKLTSGEPPSLRFACMNPLRALPSPCRSSSGLSSHWQSDLHLNFFVAPTPRRVAGARKFTTGWRREPVACAGGRNDARNGGLFTFTFDDRARELEDLGTAASSRSRLSRQDCSLTFGVAYSTKIKLHLNN